jgi:hypothetical protein
MDEVLEQEYAKGEIAGLHLARNIVSTRIEDLTQTITELLKDQEHAEDPAIPADGKQPDGRLDLEPFNPSDFTR